MITYGAIRERAEVFLKTRRGLAEPKNKSDFNRFAKELTGMLCGAAYDLKLNDKHVFEYLDLVQPHIIRNINTSGRGMTPFHTHIDPDILEHPLYNELEHSFMAHKPGSTQVGLGEFFVCFYSADSFFGIDNTNGFDVIVDGEPTELKTIGSQKDSPEKFDQYVESGKVTRLMAVQNVNPNAKKPRLKARYTCVDLRTTPWREVFEFRGNVLTTKK